MILVNITGGRNTNVNKEIGKQMNGVSCPARATKKSLFVKYDINFIKMLQRKRHTKTTMGSRMYSLE